MSRSLTYASLAVLLTGCPKSDAPIVGPTPLDQGERPNLGHASETHLADVIQLTYDSGENAEAYWSHDGQSLIFQSKRPPYACDQIMTVRADGSSAPSLVSTGKGRTTCAYYMPSNDRVVWSSTHLASDACPPEPDHSQGYVWALYPEYEIFSSKTDGTDLVKLTDSPGYDAEATVCPVDGSIIFTSTRDGDLELYRMDADGQNVVRLTHTPGYDGGAFFSRDCKHIIWRASRPTGDALVEFNRLLAQNLVRPSQLEIYVADADGTNARQVTYLGAASFAPYFHPSNGKILFSTNYPEPRGREFDIYSINVDGSGLERITHTPGFDGFPMFSPDGTKLAFASNRNNAKEGETDVFVARWVEGAKGEVMASAADQFASDVAWLADDARGGRGVATEGIEASAAWIEAQLAAIGVEPGFAGSYRQRLDVPIDVVVSPRTALALGKETIPASEFVPAAFSASATATAKTVYVGFGITAPDLGHDDYAGKVGRSVKGKVAVIRRFVPDGETWKDPDVDRKHSDLYRKAFLAREKGAVGVIFIDVAEPAKDGQPAAEEVPLPPISLARLQNVGIPVLVAKRSVGDRLNAKSTSLAMTVDLLAKTAATDNVVGVLRANAAGALPGVVVIGAHYDHLGLGGASSLEPGVSAPHNGADDNASGVAGMLAAARTLAAEKSRGRDIYFVAFTAEEIGLLGSSHFVKNLPLGVATKDIVAMLNMDMIGRLRENLVAVFGAATAAEWEPLVSEACAAARIGCAQSGDGYGPSDQTSFYAAGIPVLHFFSGAHGDYHKTTDDSSYINAGGGAQIAAALANVAIKLTALDGRLTYKEVPAPLPTGDRRSWGASLGTVPDYADKGDVPGVLLSGVRPGGPADQAGVTRGDRITKIGDTEVRTVQDLVFVLQSAKPGVRVPIVVLRDGKPVTLKVTFGESKRPAGR